MSSPSAVAGMTTSLADQIGRVLGLHLSFSEFERDVLSPTGRRRASAKLDPLLAKFTNALHFGTREEGVEIAADFAARYLLTFADRVINTSFGSTEDVIDVYVDSIMTVMLPCTPSSVRLLRDHLPTYTALFRCYLSALRSTGGRWDLGRLHRNDEVGAACRDRFTMVVGIVATMVSITGTNGFSLSVLHVSPEDIAKVSNLESVLRNQRPLGPRAYLHGLDGDITTLGAVARSLSDGSVGDHLKGYSQYKYWVTCEAAKTSNLGPCTEVPVGEEMSCCGRCLSVRYCLKAHQKAHWKTHKPICFKPTW